MVFSEESRVGDVATVNFISYQKQSVATLKGVVGYVCLQEKTTSHTVAVPLVSGKDCVADHAIAEFLATKNIYDKTDEVQFYHYTQSFKAGLDISPHLVHQIALEFAEKNYEGFEVLVATHMDAAHLHSHLIINSVSFETGKKLHQPPNTLRKLRQSSDEICKAHGLEILPPYEFGQSKTQSRAEKRAKSKGLSWKGELVKAIAKAMEKSKTKQQFLNEMVAMGYGVKWTDTRKTITYQCPNGKSCRDSKLYGDKFSKANMELEFEIRQSNATGQTGWEQERAVLFAPPKPQHSHLLREIFWAAKAVEDGMAYDDELQTIANLGALTLLSFAGVYLLLDRISPYKPTDVTDKSVEELIEELHQDPENHIDFEDEQEQSGFTMTMGGY